MLKSLNERNSSTFFIRRNAYAAFLLKDPASDRQDNSPHRIRTGFALRLSASIIINEQCLRTGILLPRCRNGRYRFLPLLQYPNQHSLAFLSLPHGKDRFIMACPPASSTAPYVLQDQRYSIFKVHPTTAVAIPTPGLVSPKGT